MTWFKDQDIRNKYSKASPEEREAMLATYPDILAGTARRETRIEDTKARLENLSVSSDSKVQTTRAHAKDEEVKRRAAFKERTDERREAAGERAAARNAGSRQRAEHRKASSDERGRKAEPKERAGAGATNRTCLNCGHHWTISAEQARAADKMAKGAKRIAALNLLTGQSQTSASVLVGPIQQNMLAMATCVKCGSTDSKLSDDVTADELRQTTSLGATSAGPGGSDVKQKLLDLAEMHVAGAITDEEFQAKKTELLGRM